MGKHSAYICFDFCVRESQDEQITRGKDSITRAIVFRLLAMDGAIKLDDEAGSMAIEVHNEVVYHLLASPAQTIELATSQAHPEQLFRQSHAAPQISGAFHLYCADPLAANKRLIGFHTTLPFASDSTSSRQGEEGRIIPMRIRRLFRSLVPPLLWERGLGGEVRG